ncbi:PTS sugar transporter subunit IIA [Enterococcus xiangfangensis]|uniref:PTS sugar transporter subunit IIA n=1 Tax=Enterococcus xiangfangensis TaxID=1296537 RepID=UPI003D16DC29|nr:PTS sugar transporter subunit IIA [Enterococcus asini]
MDLILISHGEFCEGLLSSMKMIAGDDYGVRAVSLIPGEAPDHYRERLEQEIQARYDGEKGTIILSDIKGGTPYQSAAYLSKKYKIGLVSGMNLPMLLTVAMEKDNSSSIEVIIEKALKSENLGIEKESFNKGERKQRAKLSLNKN